jgi:hypothetical protein
MTPGGDGRPLSETDTTNGINYAKSLVYAPRGAISPGIHGNVSGGWPLARYAGIVQSNIPSAENWVLRKTSRTKDTSSKARNAIRNPFRSRSHMDWTMSLNCSLPLITFAPESRLEAKTGPVWPRGAASMPVDGMLSDTRQDVPEVELRVDGVELGTLGIVPSLEFFQLVDSHA